MMRPSIITGNAPPCCRDRRTPWARCGLTAIILSLSLVPAIGRCAPPAAEDGSGLESGGPDPVLEALFLCDPVAPGGAELGLSVAGRREEDGTTSAQPHLQVAWALGPGLGLAADLALAEDGRFAPGDPSLSLKAVPWTGAGGRAGLAASLDLLGSLHRFDRTEAGVGLAAWRAVGPVTWRAGLTVATGLAAWTPHLHGGVSAALALGPRVRLLAELVAEMEGGHLAAQAGPGLKVALGDVATLGVGALLGGATGRPAAFTVGLTCGL